MKRDRTILAAMIMQCIAIISTFFGHRMEIERIRMFYEIKPDYISIPSVEEFTLLTIAAVSFGTSLMLLIWAWFRSGKLPT